MKLKISKNTIAYIYLVVFCLLMTLMTMTGVSNSAPEIVFFIYFMGMVLFLFLVSNNSLKTSNDKILFWGSFLLKVAYALYRFPITRIADPSLSGDAAGFWRTAVQYYEGDFSRVYTPFPYVLNFEFHIFGKNVLCCCITNIVLSMLMVRSVFSIMNKLHIKGKARTVASLIIAFLPYSVMLTNSILRESIYFFLIALSLEIYIDYMIERKTQKFYLSLLCLFPVLYMQIGYFPIAFIYLLDKYKYNKVITKKQLLGRIFEVCVLIVFVLAVLSFDSISYITGSTGGINGIIKKLANSGTGEDALEAGSRYLGNWQITSIGTFLLYGPIRCFFYLFSPLPTHWRGLSDIVAFLFDSSVHFFAFYCGLKQIRYSKSTMECRICKVALYSVFLCAFIFGLGTSTAGTAMRHRDVMLAYEAVIIGICLSKKHSRRMSS